MIDFENETEYEINSEIFEDIFSALATDKQMELINKMV